MKYYKPLVSRKILKNVKYRFKSCTQIPKVLKDISTHTRTYNYFTILPISGRK